MVYGDVAFTGSTDHWESNSEYFFWIPIVGPLVGGFTGVMIYTLLVSAHWPDDEEIPDFSEDVVQDDVQVVQDSNL